MTVLGIVIGVGAVIALMAIGTGVQNSITGQIAGVGTNLIYVSSGNQDEEIRNPKPLTLDDVDAIADPLSAPSVMAVAPTISGSMEVSTSLDSERVQITGVTPVYAQVANESVTEGNFFTEEQLSAHSAVALIGVDTANTLFGRSENLVGEKIRINGTSYVIVGILESKGSSAMGSQDDRVLVPLTTAQIRLFPRDVRNSVDTIMVQAVDSESVTSATEEISEIIRTRHRTEVGLDDFTLFTQDSMLSMVTTITDYLTIFLGGIAGISLLVGGIGIMNIMLVSVSERTHEIGLRKAIGARKKDILAQFLTESVVLSFIGGILGIILAALLALLIKVIAAALGAAIVPVISVNSILLATLFAMGVGLVFGIYPANRAANLEPVEALRYE